MHDKHPLSRPVICLLSAAGTLLVPCCSAAFGQNLGAPPAQPKQQPVAAIPPHYQPQATPAQAPQAGAPAAGQPQNGQPAPQAPAPTTSTGQEVIAPPQVEKETVAQSLNGVSLFAVGAPPPKRYQKHDLVQVIINETSAESSTQTTDFKKDYTLKAELAKFPSLSALLSNATLTDGIGSVHPGVGVTGNKELKGTGKSDRKDQVTAKISAFVVDTKPNGNLVLEARMTRKDKEYTTVVLSGTCRAEDITQNNTIQSSQIAGLTIRIEHEGDVSEANEKGLIPRVLETIFPF
ncbi:MAG TPA: flagellar basal body L-ring protein FlgH [Phycisphaerales bacterium]|nr:flagellar basal body L-ring protein FlgH [Phycisphaerales bacterium]